ncbi:MAG: hypothetical protein DYH13_00115 [Alphaproteobacteria bacterium PRO2]|nr:hypothetical protein [Alphaproteobacteria bacterium PRO2]
MENKSHQRPDYASFAIPGRDVQPVEEQARNFLLSARVAIKRERVEVGEFNRGYFDKELAKTFNRNATVNALRSRRANLLDDARKAFYDFTIALKELETSASPDIRNAVITLIANELLNKPVETRPAPVLQRVKNEKQKPQEHTSAPSAKRTAPLRKKAQAKDAPVIQDKQTLLYQRAEKILNSTLDPVQQKRVLALGKIPDDLEEQLSKIIDSDSSIAAIRAKTPEILPEILKQFRDFKMAVEVLNYQHISDELQHAVLGIIADKFFTKKPQASKRAPVPHAERLTPKIIASISAKMSEEMKKRYKNPEYLAAHKQRMKSLHKDPVYVARRAARISEGMKRRHQDPKYAAAHIERMKNLTNRKRQLEEEKKNLRSERARERMKKLLADPDYAIRHSKRSSEHMKKLHENKQFSAEHRERASKSLKKLHANPVYAAQKKKRSSELIKKLNTDPKFIALSSERMKRLHADPDFAANHSKRSSEHMRRLNADPKFASEKRERGREHMAKLHAKPEFVAKISQLARATMTKLNNDPEFAAEHKKRAKKLNDDPVFQQKRLAGIHAYWARRHAEKSKTPENIIPEHTDGQNLLLENAAALETAAEEIHEPEFALIPE